MLETNTFSLALFVYSSQNMGYSTNVTNPCYPRGYAQNETAHGLWLRPCSVKPKSNIFPINDNKVYSFFGSGDYEECQKTIKNLFNETSCNFGTCSFNGIYQPNISGNFIVSFSFSYYLSVCLCIVDRHFSIYNLVILKTSNMIFL